jgi:hypothetical protein
MVKTFLQSFAILFKAKDFQTSENPRLGKKLKSKQTAQMLQAIHIRESPSFLIKPIFDKA